MVYLFHYQQTNASEQAYASFLSELDKYAFLHEISRGSILVAPARHIYHIRESLEPCLRSSDLLSIHPVTVNDLADPDAHQFVEYWTRKIGCYKPATVAELMAQLDDYA